MVYCMMGITKLTSTRIIITPPLISLQLLHDLLFDCGVLDKTFNCYSFDVTKMIELFYTKK